MRIAIAAALICLGMMSMAHAQIQGSPEANKAMVRKVIHLLNIEHKIDEAIDKFFTPDFIEHDPSSATGAEAMRTYFKQFFVDNPKATLEVKRMIAEGDLVAVHFKGHITPGDRGVAGVEIFRIANGRCAEHWMVMQDIPEKSLNTNGMI
jgi:predicted SnoaL-like aldol condensation-catalyzing enzyme